MLTDYHGSNPHSNRPGPPVDLAIMYQIQGDDDLGPGSLHLSSTGVIACRDVPYAYWHLPLKNLPDGFPVFLDINLSEVLPSRATGRGCSHCSLQFWQQHSAALAAPS